MAREIGGFGRLIAPRDGGDTDFLMRSAIPQIRALGVAPKPRKRPYNEGPLLNQGQKPHCCGFSGKGFLNAAPIMSKDGDDPSAVVIYNGAQDNDEWAGKNYDGSSVRGTMKFLLIRGDINAYVWGQSVEEAIAWMNGGHGTVIIGTDWFEIFDEVDANGFMRMPSQLTTPIGGHAYRLNWYDAKIGGFLVVNSWGPNWGIRKANGQHTGKAYMSKELLAFLLRAHGEIAAPTQVKIKPVRL